ncbi:hypothetical protein HY009_04085 [Candidatus Acetothermia bacterium]|nr:hypothetical protein [Candidatus Acetothermia bacterium]
MNKQRKSTISKATSYHQMGEYWDTHDLAEYWDKTRAVSMTIEIESEVTYYALETELADRVQRLARRRGISPGTLLNLWVQEKLQEQRAD